MGMVAGAVVLLLLLLLAAAMLHVFLGWPLLVGVALFALCAGRLGRTGREIGKMIADGLGKAWIVVQVLSVIGLLTASWIACGAIPYLVRLGTLLIRPHVFLVCCFWLCAAMSFLLGTSFGTANTVGVVLITIARAGGVSIPMTAGAILCGIYFGDRSSPMSSSLLLLSTLSETRLYDNVRMGLASSAIPFALASGGYLLCSYVSPLSAASGQMAEQLAGVFRLHPLVLLPTAVVLLLCVARKPVKWAMAVSTVLACILAVTFQGMPPLELARTLVLGFSLPEGDPLHAIVHGGGLASMVKSCVIVASSCAIAGLVEGLRLTDRLSAGGKRAGRLGTYLKTLSAGAVTAAIGCNQTIAIVLTHTLRKEDYEELGRRELARDLSFGGTLAPVLVPWCIASYTPLEQLGATGVAWIPYAFWLWLMLAWQGVCCLGQKKGRLERWQSTKTP